MDALRKKIQNAAIITAVIFAALFPAGCGDSEISKGISDAVKKTVEGEIAKTGQDIKKQFDQVINPGAGSGQKEDGHGGAGEGKEKSGKGSGEGSSEEKD